MKLSQIALLAISCGILFQSCAKYDSPILVDRGVKPFEREYHLKAESFGVDRKLHKPFMQGYVTEGMTADMVSLLWGPADKESEDGKMWDYVNKKGTVITTVIFNDKIVVNNEEKKIVTDIQGDRYGGSPAPQN